jgi:O-antigen ligase
MQRSQSRTPNGVSPGVQRYLRSREAPATGEVPFAQVLRLLLLHLPLMLLFRAAPILGMLYSLAIVGVGLHYLVKDEQPTRVVWVIGYLAGAEILWRGAEAALVWEYGKYATLLLCGLILLKYRIVRRAAMWPLLFIAILIPGVFVAPGFDREAVSYQLAGPVALGILSLVCSALEFRRAELQRLLLAILAPTVAMGFFVFITLFTRDVAFSSSGANEEITGGIGANQVASALSLGAMAAFFYIFLIRRDRRLRYVMIFVALALLGLAVLTFSRAGLWNTVGPLVVAIFFMLQDRQRIFNVLAILLVIGLLVFYVSFPVLNNLTGGAVLLRFVDIDTTGRDVLIQIDYEIFKDNPVWGVGVGESPPYHVPYFGYPKPSHTEYTRLLAEHGYLGVAAIVLLAGVTLSRYFSRRSAISKAISTGFTTWTLLYLAHSATRMVAPSLTFGLAAARFLTEEEEGDG